MNDLHTYAICDTKTGHKIAALEPIAEDLPEHSPTFKVTAVAFDGLATIAKPLTNTVMAMKGDHVARTGIIVSSRYDYATGLLTLKCKEIGSFVRRRTLPAA